MKERGKLNRIYTHTSFEAAIGRYLEEKANDNKYATLLAKKRFTIKDTDTSYRVINHWSSLGLIDDDRNKEKKGWRKFSLVDMVWVRVLIELRKFGLSLEKIKVGYTAVHESKEIFECGILLCMMRKGVNLIVFSDGMIEVVPRDAVAVSESMGYLTDPAYLVISLNGCLNKVIPNGNYSPKLDTFELSDKEISALSKLRAGKYDEVNVRLKDGDIERIDTKEKLLQEIGKLSDILNDVEHGEIIIKKHAGKIAFLEKVSKKKV